MLPAFKRVSASRRTQVLTTEQQPILRPVLQPCLRPLLSPQTGLDRTRYDDAKMVTRNRGVNDPKTGAGLHSSRESGSFTPRFLSHHNRNRLGGRHKTPPDPTGNTRVEIID